MIVKGKICGPFELRVTQSWVNEALEVFTGNFASREVRLPEMDPLNVTSVHMPSWQFPHLEFTNKNVSDVILPNYRKMFMSELLWAALKETVPNRPNDFIVGGDFNTSEFLGSTKRGHDANHEAIHRIIEIGFIEVVRHMHGKLIPSWRDPRRYIPMKHQLDHLYVSGKFQENLCEANIDAAKTYFEPNLSDHLPIIADFNFN